MLVIEGYSGKSLEVAKFIDSLKNQDILIITNDKQALKGLSAETSNRIYITEQSNLKDIEDILGLNYRFKHVIFYQNVKNEEIVTYKKLEYEFDLKAVLTVQTHDRENPREVTKYTV